MNLQVETLLDSEVKPTMALFAAVDNTAYDLVRMTKKEIPLGILLSKKDSVVLHFEATEGMDLSEWELIDVASGQVYPTDAPVVLNQLGSSIGRFILKSSADRELEENHRTYVEYVGNGQIRVAALADTIQSVAVYTMAGALCSKVHSHAMTAMLEVSQNEPVLIKVVMDSGHVDTYKMIIPVQ